MPTPEDRENNAIFASGWPEYNKPARIVTLGHYYPKKHAGAAENLLREARGVYTASAPIQPRAMQRNLGWTQLINALNSARQWPLKRLFTLLDPMLAPEIAL